MPFVAIPKKDAIFGVLYLELFLLAITAIVVFLYQVFGLNLRAPVGLYLERIKGTIPCYLVGLTLALFLLRLRHLRHGFRLRQLVPHQMTWQAFREGYLIPKSLLHDLRLLNATCIMFVLFVNLKHLIPFMNGALFDAQLERVDRAIFRGVIGGEFLHERFGVAIAPLLSTGYTLFYSYVAFLIYLFVLQRDRRLTHEFLFAFFLLWFGGLTIVYLYPTQGPIFYDPQSFSALPLTEVSEMQQKLWKHKLALDMNPIHEKATYLISGLPSLHFAVPILGSLYLARIHWLLAAISWAFVGITAITTVYFGWHWVMDDLIAVILALVVFRHMRRRYRPDYLYVPYAPPSVPSPR